MGPSFSLSLTEADVLAQLLGTNIRLFPFEVPSAGRLEVDRRRIAREVFADLGRRGFIRHGEVDPDLDRAMRAVSDYAVAVAVLGTVEQTREIYARASAVGETGVLAVRDGDRIRLELIRPTALPSTVVGLLPRAQAGPGQSVTISRPAPVALSRRLDAEDEDPFGGVRLRTGADQRLRMAAGYLARPRTGTGFFAVSGRDRHNRERRGGGITWIDTDVGRYLSLSRPATEDGEISSTFSPADSARLTQALAEMITSVSR